MNEAVSLLDPVFDAAERLARERQIARSQLFTQALEEYISPHAPEAVTAKLNEVYFGLESAGSAAALLPRRARPRVSPTPEQKAREDIDAALEAAGWIV